MSKRKGLSWLHKEETTRSRSKRQESKLAKDLKGYGTKNSGATFGENDVITDFCEIEAKITGAESFVVKYLDLLKLVDKCNVGKIPIMVVEFEKHKKGYAVLPYEDLKYLIEKANEHS